MDELSQLIKDSFDVISLILVFAFVLFDIRYPRIINNLNIEIPPKDRKIERKNHRIKLMQSLYLHSLPLIIIYGVLLYIQLPLFFRVVLESKVQLWNFNFLRSAFFVIITIISIFLVWSIYLAVRLLFKISQCKQ